MKVRRRDRDKEPGGKEQWRRWEGKEVVEEGKEEVREGKGVRERRGR